MRLLITLALMALSANLYAQDGESSYKIPKGMVKGGAFIDLFLPMPIYDGLETDVWGGDNVKPRDADNGIEDPKWSYWGGNVLHGVDGKEHLFVSRWAESSKKGHMEWSRSYVVHAVSDKPTGPFKVAQEIGRGHNPEIYQAKDGTYVLYVINACYLSKSLDGPWKRTSLKFDQRGLGAVHMSNLTFSEREDHSILMVSRTGQVWISEDGLKPYKRLTQDSVYPPIKGRFEDPVVWRDEIQYHLIINDWYGRIAYYLRSKDGFHWTWDDGKAYDHEVVCHPDGTKEGWYKLERPKVRQDKYGRATHMYFAVIDGPKRADKGNDNHSSKNVALPLTIGRRLTILNKQALTAKTKEIQLLIKAEEGFDPQKDVDVKSLHLGAAQEVNFGRGSTALKSEASGADLLVTFNGQGNGLTAKNFAAKLIGKTKKGALLFGYARLPEQAVHDPILVALPATVKRGSKAASVVVENFGLVTSGATSLKLEIKNNKKNYQTVIVDVPAIKAYENATVTIPLKTELTAGSYKIDLTVAPGIFLETKRSDKVNLE